MQPHKFRSTLNKAIEYKLKTGKNDKFTPYLLRKMKKVWIKWAKEEEDFSTGTETYGYDDEDSIFGNLHYISDRWRCAFRLKWLIDGIENGKILEVNHYFNKKEI